MITINSIFLTFLFPILVKINDQLLNLKFRLGSKFICLFILEAKELNCLLITGVIFLALNLKPLSLLDWVLLLLIVLIFHLKFEYHLVVFLFSILSLIFLEILFLPLIIFFDFKLFYDLLKALLLIKKFLHFTRVNLFILECFIVHHSIFKDDFSITLKYSMIYYMNNHLHHFQ